MQTLFCRRQLIDAVPTHLHTQKTERPQHVEQRPTATTVQAQVDIQQVYTPSDCSPCLFRVPIPKVAPSRLCPQRTAHHPQCQKCHSDIYQTVNRRKITIRPPNPTCQSKYKGATEYGVGENIDRNMRNKPKTLQRRHQRLVVYLGFEQIDHDEDQRYDGCKEEQPTVMPSAISQ